MKKITLLLMIMMLWPSIIFAGIIRGSIKVNGKPLREDILIKIIPDRGNPDNPYTAKMDKFGTYRLNIKETGRCRFIISNYKNHDIETEIFSYETPVEYNFILEKDEKGEYYLRRE